MMKVSLQRPLLPSDIWRLRSINDTRMLYYKFRQTKAGKNGTRFSIGRRLMRANARDITLDICYTLISVTLSYGSTYLMKVILEAIAEASANDEDAAKGVIHRQREEWTPRQRAFVFALASVLLQVFVYVFRLLNFHHARQVGLRVRSVMVAELYEKALKRRSRSGTGIVEDKARAAPPHGLRAKMRAVFTKEKAEERAARLKDETQGPRGSEQSSRTDKPAAAADVGKVVNMMSADVNVLLRLGCDFHQLSKVPVDIVVATLFLCSLLGWSALAGFSLLLLTFPLNYLAGKASVAVQRKWKQSTDERMGLVTELLGAARFVKLQGVTSRWHERVLAARNKEIKSLYRVRYTQMAFGVLFTVLSKAVSLLSFFCFIKVQGNELTVPVAFTALMLFESLNEPLNTIPNFAIAILNAFVSLRRLETFLAEEEVEPSITALSDEHTTLESLQRDEAGQRLPIAQQYNTERLEIIGGSFSWSPMPKEQAVQHTLRRSELQDVTVSFPPGVLSVITGPTGSGKTTLLHAILGEIKQTTGTTHLPKWAAPGPNGERQSGLSYAAQAPWLEGGKSIKQNILFCYVYNKKRYEDVLHACALLDDLALFEEGDQTQISSTTLSGGQQARLSLARALYAPSHTVILDDPLAAVDAHVQQHLVRHALGGPIASNRRVILVTHHFAVVSQCTSYLVYLNEGKVKFQGSISDLRRDGKLSGVLAEQRSFIEPHFDQQAESSRHGSASSLRVEECQEASRHHAEGELNTSETTFPIEKRSARLLYQLEKRRIGAVKLSVYGVYLRVSSPLLWATIITLTLLARTIGSGESYWIKIWGEASGDSGRRTGLIAHFPPAQGHENFYLAVYGLIGLSLVVSVLVRTLIFWTASVRASQQLYVQLLSAVLAARLRFFDTNPLGRILQRFNQDVNVMDNSLPGSFMEFIRLLPAFFFNLAICGIIVPWFLVPILLFMIWFPSYFRGFLATTQDMQRIESTSTSPLYTAFASSMAGVTTIRAFGAERSRLAEMLTILDVTQAQWWAICTIEVWGSFRCQLSAGAAVFVVTMLALGGTVSAGSAGMVMSSAELMAVLTYYLIENWKRLSNDLNSIERIVEYLDLPAEKGKDSAPQCQPPAAWPTSFGAIHIEDLTVSYDDDLPDVLHDVSLDIGPCEKVGIVGRTGSGKTTLASVLFRAIEAKKGRIIVDGIDIASLDVDALRRSLCIVPQSPVLFSGTIRTNLDPFDEKTDEECLWALRRVRIRATASAKDLALPLNLEYNSDAMDSDGNEFVPVMTTSLDAEVAAAGANFSAGEAQLLSLARALLRDARVVVLDEATSSTDSGVDAAIQRAVRGMRDSTVITVAHRLATVLDYDRIVVLSRGKVVESGSPRELMRTEESEFRRMVEAMGIKYESVS